MKKKNEEQVIDKSPEVEEIKADSRLHAKVNHAISPEVLRVIIQNKNTKILNVTAQSYDPHNIADALKELDSEDLLFFFKAVDPDDSAEVFTLLDQEKKEQVIEAFSSADLQALVTEMQTDDLVDFVDELPANLVNKVIKATPKSDRDRIDQYLNFKEASAGTLMTPEYLSVRDTDTVKKAIAKIRKDGEGLETVWRIFVVDSTRKLVGIVRLDHLLESDEDELMKNIMDEDFVSVSASTDEEVVIKAFRKYDISVLPVTNKQQRMLGIITFDDVMDAANEETTEDIQLAAGVIPTETPYLKTKPLKLVKSYAIWLVILLFLDTFISMALSYLDRPLEAIPLLTAFLTAIMGTNSNAADQTTTVIIREIALGNVTPRNYWKAVFKEFKSAIITGLILAIFAFGWTLLELYSGMISLTAADNGVIESFYDGNRNLFFISIASIISLSFIVVIIIAKWLGVTIPLLAKVLHIDPAVMSQPVISTILDVVSIVFYFLISTAIMKGIGI